MLSVAPNSFTSDPMNRLPTTVIRKLNPSMRVKRFPKVRLARARSPAPKLRDTMEALPIPSIIAIAMTTS